MRSTLSSDIETLWAGQDAPRTRNGLSSIKGEAETGTEPQLHASRTVDVRNTWVRSGEVSETPMG